MRPPAQKCDGTKIASWWYAPVVARASRSRKPASAKRRRREVDYPAHASREYRVDPGHDYVLNGVPFDVWERVKKRAHAEQRAVRVVLIRALDTT